MDTGTVVGVVLYCGRRAYAQSMHRVMWPPVFLVRQS